MVAQASALPTQARHLVELDGFRALSILAVLATHMLPVGPAEWGLNQVTGSMGMAVFFSLSGFLITRFLWEQPDVKVFMIRRLARIVPLILLATTVYCLIFQFRPDSFVAVNLYVINYAGSAMNPAISPLWSVAVEMHFYVLIALAVLIFGRRGFWLVPVCALIVTGLRIEHGVFTGIQTHFRVDEILSGSLLAILWLNADDPRAARLLDFLARGFWPILAVWLLSCSQELEMLGYARPYLTAMLVGSVLAKNGGWQRTFLGSNTLRYIALISFALYVWHSPFRHYWFAGDDVYDRYLIKRPIGIAATFLLAHLSTFYFEKPITDMARNWTRGFSRSGRNQERPAAAE